MPCASKPSNRSLAPIKSVMGFRQFSLRGLDLVNGEWSLVCLAWNLKRMAVLRPKFG
ncbi:transposase [Massilia sp. TSP1-1-2]|uniref:transposase n=1 Tax=Massilia sp. TSP1-1-2 TaxID=2804649 RepID=UPI003CEB1882